MAAVTVYGQDQINGQVTSSSIAVPLNSDGTPAINPDTGQPYASVAFVAPMSQSDAENASKTARGSIVANFADNTFETFDGGDWEWNGGAINTHTGLYRVPSLGVSIPSKLAADGATVLWAKRLACNFDTEGNTINTALTLELV